MDDKLILDLIQELSREYIGAGSITAEGFSIFVANSVFLGGKVYRLVLTTHPNENYIGVINAFRRRGK